MKRDLIMGIVFIFLVLLMIFCIIINCINANWAAMPICIFALILNIFNASNRFVSWRRYRQMRKKLDECSSGIYLK